MKDTDSIDISKICSEDIYSDTVRIIHTKEETKSRLLIPKYNRWEQYVQEVPKEREDPFWKDLEPPKILYVSFNIHEGIKDALQRRGSLWPDQVSETKRIPYIHNIVNALTASFLGLAVMVPMDFLRAIHIIYRTWPNMPPTLTFHSLFACSEYPFRNRAFTTMYMDLAKDFMLLFPQFAIKLAVNEYYLYAIASRQDEASRKRIESQIFAAILTGCSTDFLTAPIKMYRWHWKDVSNNTPFYLEPPTPRNLLRQIFMQSIGRERFKLVVQTAVIENLIFCSTFFPVRYLLFAALPEDLKREYAVTTRFMVGFTAATFAQACTSPMANVKQFLGHIPMPDKDNPNKEPINEFKNIREATKHFYKKFGIGGFYENWWCQSLLRSRIYAIVHILYEIDVPALIYESFIKC